jgi:succinate dehydrogenase/fumarate reductase-like Fe-S protein
MHGWKGENLETLRLLMTVARVETEQTEMRQALVKRLKPQRCRLIACGPCLLLFNDTHTHACKHITYHSNKEVLSRYGWQVKPPGCGM